MEWNMDTGTKRTKDAAMTNLGVQVASQSLNDDLSLLNKTCVTARNTFEEGSLLLDNDLHKTATENTHLLAGHGKVILATCLVFLLLPMAVVLNLVCILYWRWTGLFYVPYLLWCLLSSGYGQRADKLNLNIRAASFWKIYSSYFPMHLITKDPQFRAPVGRPIILGYHPHGIYGVGCSGQFAAYGSNFIDLFPGVNVRPAVVNFLIKMPFFREILLFHGCISVSRKSICRILEKGEGNAVIIVVGGAREAIYTRNNSHDLILNKRKGIFYFSLKYGAALIPTYSFGENNLFTVFTLGNFVSSILSKVTNSIVGITIPLFLGHLKYLGIPPFSMPINTVIGNPILCEQISQPTLEDINNLRNKYREELLDIFDKFKDKYCENSLKERLKFID